eukprot:336448_1
MSWLEHTDAFLQHACPAINDYHSEIWQQISISLQTIHNKFNISQLQSLSNCERIKSLLQQKSAWLADKNSTEQIITAMLYHMDFEEFDTLISMQPANIELFTTRAGFMTSMFGAISFYCLCNERFDHVFLKDCFVSTMTIFSMDKVALVIECFDELKNIPNSFFWLNYYKATSVKYEKLRLGFILIFCSKYVASIVSNKTEHQLQKKLVSMNKDFYDLNKTKHWKNWKNNVEIRQIGLNIVKTEITDVHENKNYSGALNFLFGRLNLQNYELLTARDYFVKSIYKASSFVLLTLSLRYLSNICVLFNEFGIALRCLKCAYFVCIHTGKYITPSFINEDYRKNKKVIMGYLSTRLCGQCLNKGKKLKSCTGCMKTVYCSRICQKKHWNHIHRKQCDKYWISHYKLLRQTIIFSHI